MCEWVACKSLQMRTFATCIYILIYVGVCVGAYYVDKGDHGNLCVLLLGWRGTVQRDNLAKFCFSCTHLFDNFRIIKRLSFCTAPFIQCVLTPAAYLQFVWFLCNDIESFEITFFPLLHPY